MSNDVHSLWGFVEHFNKYPMSIDWGSVLTGGLTGAAAGGVPGALIGAGAGIINGIFGGGQDAPSYQKYSDPYTNSIISKMMNSKLGETAAAHTAGELRAQARDQYQSLSSNPNIAGNTSVLAALNNRLQRQAETGIAGANIAGAQQDQQSQEQGAQLQNQQNQQANNRNQFEMERYNTNRQPTFTQDLFGKGVNAVIGAALGKQFGKTDDPTQQQPPQYNPSQIPSDVPNIGAPDTSQPPMPPTANLSGAGDDSQGLSGGLNYAPVQQSSNINGGFNGIDFLRNIRPQATGYNPSSVGY